MHEDNIIMSRWMKFLGVSRNGDSHKGFTLTEILIALAVVGIIAVLILPVITSRAQNRGFSLSYDAEVREIMNSLEGLTLNENVKSFDKTIMNVDSARAAANAGDERSAANEIHNVEGTAGQFLRKYTKVAKYCGATSVGCFAQTYFKYNDRNREGFILENIISGQEQYTVTVDGVETSLDFSHMACAILKNGMSLCISPQVRNPVTGDLRRPVRGFIDLNGPKEPNVLGRDLRSFSMDLATRTITAPEASNVIIPDTPPVCQDGECCEDKFANGELAERDLSAPKDACCATLIASQGLGAVLPYCCSTSDTSPECCNYMKGKVNVDELPAACKPEPERTPCEKLALGDTSQLAACCDDRSDSYWSEHDWDQTCCSLQEDKCCSNKNSKIWTAQNPWAGSCCGKYPNDPLCSAECSAEKWEDACCETVDHGSSIWRENCCSLAVNKDDKNCCKSDGLNVHNKFRTVCCLSKKGISELGQPRNIDCCYQSKWEDDCCAAAESKIGTGKKDKNNKIWENHCCSQAKYMDEDYCCKDGKNKYGNGSYTENCCGLMDNKYSYAYANHCCSIIDDSSSDYADYCCDSSTTYDWDNPCCNIHEIGCPNTCEDDGYYDRNIIDCCKSNFNEGKCCALDVYTNDSRCCSDGKNADGDYTQECCSSSASSTDSKIACCNKAWLHKDVCCADDIKGSQSGYECTEPLSCENIYEDYKKIQQGNASGLDEDRINEVNSYWSGHDCCNEYSSDTVVCPPTGPCALGRSGLQFTYDKPAGSGLGNYDIYIKGLNFGEYKNKNITVTVKNRGVSLYHKNNAGTCDWMSYAYDYGDITFTAHVGNDGNFYAGYNFSYTDFYTADDRSRGYKLKIINMDNPQIHVNGERKDSNVMDSWCYSADLDTFSCPEHSKCEYGKMNGEYTLECCEKNYKREGSSSTSANDECCKQDFAKQLSFYSSVCVPTTECTPNTLTLKYTSRGLGDAGCSVSANEITYSLEAERPVDDNITVQLKYYNQHFNRDGSVAEIKDIYKTLTISKGSKTSSSVKEVQNICPDGSIAGCITDSCYNAHGVNRIFGAEISHIAGFSNSGCYPLIGGTDATCPSLSVAGPMDVTSQCCKEWGESAVNNLPTSTGIKDKCCDYPDIAEDWSICGGTPKTCEDYKNDRSSQEWSELSCCAKDEYYKDESCCSGKNDGKGNVSQTCCEKVGTFSGLEDECCNMVKDSPWLKDTNHKAAWLSGCCSADTTDDDCCTAKVNKDGLKPGDFCCSSNKYKNDPRCQTPCDKVQKGTATEADKKACCQEENNSIWTTNEAWTGACCTLTDDNGYYLYRRDNSKAAMCCSAWVDSQMIKYNPSEYNSSDGKSGGCPRFDKTCIYQNFSGSVEACTLSCSTNGSPNEEYVNKYCCNEWKSGSKLQQGTELFNQCCTLLQNDDNVWLNFCTTCDVDSVSKNCCMNNLKDVSSTSIPSDKQSYICACCRETDVKYIRGDLCNAANCCQYSTPDINHISTQCCKEWQDSGKLENASTEIKNKCCEDNQFYHYNYTGYSHYCKQTRVNSGCQLHFKWNFNDSLSNYGGFNWNYNTGFTSLDDNGYVCRGNMGAYMKVVSTFVPPTPCASRTYFHCPNGGFDTKIYPNTNSAPCTIIASHFYTGTSNCTGTWDHAFPSELSPPGNPKCQVYNALTDELISEYCNSNDDPRYKNDGYRYSEGQKIQYEYCYPNCQ